MKFGNWKRFKEGLKKLAATLAIGAKLGGNVIEKAKPLISIASDFIQGGEIIKKGTEVISKIAEPTSEVLNRIASGENVVGATKKYLNQVKSEIPNDITKTASKIINQVPEHISLKPKGRTGVSPKSALFAKRLNAGKKIAGIGGKLYKTTGNITTKLIPISKGIASFLPGGETIGKLLERIPKWYETNGKALTEISEGKKIKDVIKDYGKTLYNDVLLNKKNLSALSPYEQEKLTQ
ncbi:hypothetical protein, conserved [Entamoeba histolytica]